MSLTISVGGVSELDKLAARLQQAGRRDLSRELGRAIRQAAGHVEDEVRDAVPAYMPRGYEDVFRASLRFTTEIRLKGSADHRITIKARAKGAKGHDRQIPALERGSLRHPVFARGRRSTWIWAAQRIRPRFFTEPALRTRRTVRRDIEAAMHRVAVKIEKG